MAASLEIIGIERLLGGLGSAVKQFRPIIQDALDKTAQDIKNDARAIVPVDTGDLKASISKRKKRWSKYIVGPRQPYGKYVEYGTRRQRAQPYLIPSFIKNKSVYQKRLEGAVGDILKIIAS